VLPLDHQQLRDHKSRRIWLCRMYMYWGHIVHFLFLQGILIGGP